MSLVKCIECGAEISSQAPACPKCGIPRIKQPPAPRKGLGCGGLLGVSLLGTVILVAFVAILGEGPHAPDKPLTATEAAAKTKEDEAKAKEDAAINRAAYGAKLLKESMRDPDSFKLVSALVVNDTGAACYEYRARNGFGGMNVGQAVLSSDGKTFKSNQMSGFTKLWNKECANKRGIEAEAAISSLVL